MRFEVSPREDTERLDRVLSARIPGLSRMRLRLALDREEVRVNGLPRPAGWRVSAGDLVTAELDLDEQSAMTPEEIPLRIYFEDDALAVVEKPAGMVVHPAGRHRSGTLANALAHHFNVLGGAEPPVRPGMVHRLDRSTSGLIVIAKTQRALSRLTVQFQQKQVEKRYLALVHGAPEGEAGEWEAPIGSDPEAFPKWGIRETGRPAHTRWRVVERLPEHTLLELEPVTGRTNQLRLHCAHFGHPIAGDDLFGRGSEPELGRLFLHAFRLVFTHPVTSARMEMESPLPPELERYLALLRSRSGARGDTPRHAEIEQEIGFEEE
ncbi:MAG: RluA family pseudouridine synthase [Armatimonadota bacterium]